MIQLHEVSKAYNDETVLDRISLRVGPAESLVIFGGSGSGKSTLLRLICGLDRCDQGRIVVDGEDITALKESQLIPVRLKMGVVFQEGRPVRLADRPPECRLPALRRGRLGRGRDRRAGGPPAGIRRAGEHRGPHAVGAFRRHAAAGGHRPGHGRPAADPALRRADGRAGPRDRADHLRPDGDAAGPRGDRLGGGDPRPERRLVHGQLQRDGGRQRAASPCSGKARTSAIRIPGSACSTTAASCSAGACRSCRNARTRSSGNSFRDQSFVRGGRTVADKKKKGFNWRELRVGIFVIGSFIILIFMIFRVSGGRGFFIPKVTAVSYLPNTSGLKLGAPVWLNGIEIGNVDEIRLDPTLPDTTANRKTLQQIEKIKQDMTRYDRTIQEARDQIAALEKKLVVRPSPQKRRRSERASRRRGKPPGRPAENPEGAGRGDQDRPRQPAEHPAGAADREGVRRLDQAGFGGLHRLHRPAGRQVRGHQHRPLRPGRAHHPGGRHLHRGGQRGHRPAADGAAPTTCWPISATSPSGSRASCPSWTRARAPSAS